MFFIDFDTIFDTLNEKFEHFDKMIDSKIDANSNIWLNVANFRTEIFWFFDLNVENKINETEKHWIDSFFIDCSALLIVAIKKIEFVDKICEICKLNVSMIVNLFSISHIDLIVSFEKNASMMKNFWTKFS